QEQFANEISAANIVHQIAELHAAKGVVAQILDDRASIGIGMRFRKLCFGQAREACEQERLELVRPQQVHDLLVGENGIGEGVAAGDQYGEKQSQQADPRDT